MAHFHVFDLGRWIFQFNRRPEDIAEMEFCAGALQDLCEGEKSQIDLSPPGF